MPNRDKYHAEVIPPSSSEPDRGALGSLAGLFHPFSGLAVLGLDWAMFGGSTASFGLGLVVFSILGFVTGSTATALVQRLIAKDSWGTSLTKGLIGGLVVGAPFPVAGTALGGFILAVCGLDALFSQPSSAVAELVGKRDSSGSR